MFTHAQGILATWLLLSEMKPLSMSALRMTQIEWAVILESMLENDHS